MAGKPNISTRERKVMEILAKNDDSKVELVELALKLNDLKDTISVLQDSLFYQVTTETVNQEELELLKKEVVDTFNGLSKDLRPKTKESKIILARK